MTRILQLAIFLWIACLITSQDIMAQQRRLTGTIDDGTGVIPDATVALRNPSGVTNQIKTDGAGQYRFDGLRAGAYEITVSRQGFVSATRAFALAGESRTVDITIESTHPTPTGMAGGRAARNASMLRRRSPG
jgi:hypothetical protein